MAVFPERPSERSNDEAQKLQAGKLWRQLPPEIRAVASESFWKDEDAVPQQAEAVLWIAKQLKFRPKSVEKLSEGRKARYLASLAGVPDQVAIRALVSFHLEHRRAMMGAFLDWLGISHENGLINEEDLKAPDPVKLEEASAKLRAEYPKEDVELYFTTLMAQDADTWRGLAATEPDNEATKTRTRLRGREGTTTRNSKAPVRRTR
ncbi:MAG: hypothetical protein ACE148_01185 [Vicinamibacterales bacterium]